MGTAELSACPSGAHTSTRDAKRRNMKIVVVSFFASLLSFFAAGIYDYSRPTTLQRILPALEYILLSTRGIDGKGHSKDIVTDFAASNLLSPCKSRGVRVALVAFVEASVLAPTLLLILPLTHRKWKEIQMGRVGMGKNSREVTEVCFLLQAIAWLIWTASAVSLIAGIVIGSHLFGMVSFSALLAFFAQGVNGVGCLLSSSILEDDDIQREAWSVREKDDVLVSATSWASLNNQDKHKKRKDISKRCKESVVACERNLSAFAQLEGRCGENSDKVSSRPKTNYRGGNIEFLLPFGMIKITLLQVPYLLQIGVHFLHSCVSCSWLNNTWVESPHNHFIFGHGSRMLPKEIPGAMVFLCTIFVPLFTHGVGGKLFNGANWSFHHPFDGGKSHVRAQATGWSLVGLAGFLHLAFIVHGMENQHVYLIHSGSVLSWCAESLLLYSLVDFTPRRAPMKGIPDQAIGKSKGMKEPVSAGVLLVGYVQDFIMTNLHWSFPFSFMMTSMGINLFSHQPTKSFLCAPLSEVALNLCVLLFTWLMPYIFISYMPHKKQWRWNPFGLWNNLIEKFLFQPWGLFSGSEMKMEDNLAVYQADGAMFALAPHGTLPTSVVAVWYQFEKVFSDVCVFFGSQIDLCPGYRFFFGMRGGFLPIEKKRLVEVMKTRQNVALVPGGVSEMLHCVPHGKTVNISIKHKGFIRLAIQHGYDVVPTFLFHANDQYNNPWGSLQHWTYKVTGIPVGVPLYTNQWGLPFSNQGQIQVALGRRIKVEMSPNPTNDMVDELHRKFYEEILRVWQKHCDSFGHGGRELAYVT